MGGRTELSHEARLHEAMQHQCESHILLPSVVMSASPAPPVWLRFSAALRVLLPSAFLIPLFVNLVSAGVRELACFHRRRLLRYAAAKRRVDLPSAFRLTASRGLRLQRLGAVQHKTVFRIVSPQNSLLAGASLLPSLVRLHLFLTHPIPPFTLVLLFLSCFELRI